MQGLVRSGSGRTVLRAVAGALHVIIIKTLEQGRAGTKP